MSLSGKLADLVAARPLQLVGFLFGCAAVAHFTTGVAALLSLHI